MIFAKTYDNIVRSFRKAVTDLENLAEREEQNAEAYLQHHLSIKALEADARAVAAKARTTAANIGKLIG